MSDNVLEIRELSKDYGDFVLDKVSFSLPRGVIMGLIGENGAGKSTTINCILNETQKTGGEILILGKDHISDEIEIKDKLGVVFDENHFPDIFTAEEIGKFMSGVYSGWEWSTYRQFLEKFELPKDKEIKDFSKGMKVKLEKEPDNEYDKEAIQVKVKGLGKIGYVANSPYTVKGESMSAGRLYDKLGDKAKGKVVFVVDGGVVCRIINTGREQTEQPCRIS